jgi:gliding motility-associated-like protein
LGGNWEDENGVSITNPFDPAAVAPDSTYTLIYSGGMGGTPCFNTQVLQLTVLSNSANAGCPTVINICESQPPINMTDTLLCDPQPNGVWTGPPGFGGGNFFIPGTSPPGVYTYTLNSACGSDSNTLTITVTNQADAGTDGILDICPSDIAEPLIGGLGGTPDTNGSWTLGGVPVNPGTVDGATVNDGDVYVYTVGSGTCTATSQVTINLLPVASAGSDVTINVCETDAIFNMYDSIPSASPGGSWIPSGPLFDPGNSTPGPYIYSITNPGCGTSIATVTVNVQSLPDAGQNTTVTVCETLGNLDLTGELTGTPEPGGTWTDVGTGNTVSNPFNLAGNCNSTFSLEYTVDNGICTSSSILDLTVACPPEAGPDVTVTLCADNSTLDLNTILDPSADTGGEFINDATSTVVTNGIITLTPGAAGTYTYEVDGAPCVSDQAVYTINLQNPLSVSIDAQCTAAQDEYIVTITASGGNGNYTVTGIAGDPFIGNVFESDPIDVGTAFQFTLSDSGPCADFVQGVTPGPNCACPADGNFVENNIDICEGGTANIELDFPGGTGPFFIDYTDGTDTFFNQGPFVSGDVIAVSPIGNTTYELILVTDQNCSSNLTDFVDVNIETAPDAGPDVSFDLCGTGGNLVLNSQIDPSADSGGEFEDTGGNFVTTIPQSTAGSGVYTYIVNGTQCPADQALYTFNFSQPLSVNVVSAVCNAAQTDYTVTLNITGGDGNYNVTGLPELSFIGNTFISQEITAGTSYNYTVSDGGPCPDVTAGPINSPNCSCPASAQFVNGPLTVCAGETANLELDFPGGTGPYYINYTDGNNPVTNAGPFNSGDFIQVSPSVTTTYSLTGVEDAFCSTTASSTITVNVETPPNAGPDVVENFCATNASYNLMNLVDGGTADSNGDFYDSDLNQINNNTITLNAASSDVYIYEVVGSACPSDQATYNITINDQVSISNIQVDCNQGQTGYFVSFDIAGGDGNYTVNGTPSGSTFQSALIPNDTDYDFTIADGSPCSDQFVSGVDPDCDCPAAASLVGTTSVCQGECATLTFNLQGDGPWDVTYENSSDPGNPVSLIDIENGHQVTVCPSATTTYTILSVNDFNCDGIVNGQPVTVTVDAPLSVSPVTETCDGINENYFVEFTVSGGIPGTYQVNPAGTSFSGGVYNSSSISSGNSYSFTVSDAGACPSVIVEGQYQCACITDAGSILPGLIEVCENENLIVPFNEDEVLDGNDGYQYVLHDGSETEIGTIIDRFNSPTIGLPAEIEYGTTYYITGVAGNTDAFGNVILADDCTDQTNGIPVVFHALPTASISGFGTVCPGENVEISVLLTGVAPWTFVYSLNGNPQPPIVTSDNDYTFDVSAPGNYTLLSVSDANCEGTISGLVEVSNFVTPTATMSGDGEVCEGSGDGPIITMTGQAPWTFFYSIDGDEVEEPITSFSNQYTIPAEEDGTYALTSLSDANCVGTVSGSLDVTILSIPTALITGGGTVCEGDELGFNISLTGASPWNITYSIDGIPQPSVFSNSPNFSFSSGENGEYIITEVTDQNCEGEALESDAELIVNPLPTAEILSNQDQICIGQELELIYDLQGTPPFTFTYLLDEDTITLSGLTTDYLEVSQPTEPVFTQVLYVEDSSNPVCTNTPNNSKFISVGELPDAPVLADDTICSDIGSVTIGVEGVQGLEYTWSPEGRLSDSKDPNPTFSIGDDDLVPLIRTYTYVLTASNGECSADDTLTITVDPGPRARFDFNPNPVNSEDTKVRFRNLTPSGDEAIYFWQFDSLDTSTEFNPTYEFPGGVMGNYTVILTAVDPITGCMDEWSDIVEVKPEMLVYVPTAFTPDGDGLNDLWRPILSNIDGDDYLITVFDRYGNRVFESRDPDKAWNGSLMGDDFFVKTGVYVWQIETKNPISQEKIDFKGTVTVIR